MIYSVIIAEDELPARELLIDYLLTRPELKLCGVARNGEEALRKLTDEEFDLLLLDIQLPVFSGLEVLERLDDIPYVIFTTAYDQYAIRAFDFGAIDYLLKPFSLDRFNQSIDRFLAEKADNKPCAIRPHDFGLSFKENGKHYLVSYQDILYISSHAKHTVIHTEDKDFETSCILKEIELKLPADIFFRVHKQHILNIGFVSNIEYNIGGQYIAFLKDKDESSIPIGRLYAPALKERLKIL
jgi:DNA-binding LytR/AlgR family response regulator